MKLGSLYRVDTLVANFPNRLETKLEMSLSLRRELNNLIKHETSTVDQVRTCDKFRGMLFVEQRVCKPRGLLT